MLISNGNVIAGAKACSLDVDVEKIGTSSPADGQWKHYVAGQKSWKISTNHLLVCHDGVDGTIKASAVTNNGVTTVGTGSITLPNGQTKSSIGRGLNLLRISKTTYEAVGDVQNFDTYADADTYCANLQAYIEAQTSDYIYAIVSYDAYGMTTTLATYLNNQLGIPLEVLKTGSGRWALVMIGDKAEHVGVGARTDYQGGTPHCQLNLTFGAPTSATPIKSSVAMVGTKPTLMLQANGFASDRLQGTALCTSWRLSGSIDNLLSGSFSWEGDGPLQ